MCPFSPKLPSCPGCHTTLSRVPCALQQVLVGHPTQQCVHVHPKLPNYPFFPFFPTGNHNNTYSCEHTCIGVSGTARTKTGRRHCPQMSLLRLLTLCLQVCWMEETVCEAATGLGPPEGAAKGQAARTEPNHKSGQGPRWRAGWPQARLANVQAFPSCHPGQVLSTVLAPPPRDPEVAHEPLLVTAALERGAQ